MIGSINYLVCITIGNALIIGIVDFEHWGGDPMKRTVLNQLTSLTCGCILLHGTLMGSMYQWITIMGPSESTMAACFTIGRTMLSTYAFLTLTEYILIQCLVVFKWKRVSLQDDFIASFLAMFNFLLSLLWTCSFFVCDFHKNNNYAFLACRESR